MKINLKTITSTLGITVGVTAALGLAALPLASYAVLGEVPILVGLTIGKTLQLDATASCGGMDLTPPTIGSTVGTNTDGQTSDGSGKSEPDCKVTAYTNNASGYTLSMHDTNGSPNGANLITEQTTALSTPAIPTISSVWTWSGTANTATGVQLSTALTTSQYGFFISDTAVTVENVKTSTFYGVPVSKTALKKTSAETAGDDTYIYFGATVAQDQAEGIYRNNVTVSMADNV